MSSSQPTIEQMLKEKRARSYPTEQQVERGTFKNFKARQDDNEKYIACARPPNRDHTIPLSLLDPIFANFVVNCKTIKPTPKAVNVAIRLRGRILLGFDDNHNTTFMSTLKEFMPEVNDEYSINGRPIVLVNIKKDSGHSGVEPMLQLSLKYDALTEQYGLREDVSSIHPCFGITVVGSHITFGGFALTDRTTVEVFSDTLMDFHHQDTPSLEKFARHLTAFKSAVDELKNRYYIASISTWPCPVYMSHMYPYPRTYMHLGTKNEAQLTYDGELLVGEKKDRYGEKLLFTAKTNNVDNYVVCVKFVRQYGRDVHEWFAAKGWAPKLLGYEVLPIGWIMIVMELLDSAWVSLGDVENGSVLVPDIQNAIEMMHKNGMVHGDISADNIMVKPGLMEFKFIDFDWSGMQGSATYPILTKVRAVHQQHGDVYFGTDILPVHDIRMWDSITEGLEDE